MRYKITITTPSLETAEILHKIIAKSKPYNSSEHIISLNPITEVCDECSKRGC